VSFLRKQESRFVPAQAGTQGIGAFIFLDSRFRGNDTDGSSPGLAFGQAGLSTARGEAGCFIRLIRRKYPPRERLPGCDRSEGEEQEMKKKGTSISVEWLSPGKIPQSYGTYRIGFPLD